MKGGQLNGGDKSGWIWWYDPRKKRKEIDIMKSLKKNLVFWTFCLSLLLFACQYLAWDYEYYLYYQNDRDISEIEQISLVNYLNPLNEENPSENEQYDVDKLEILETLNSDEYGNFLSELSEIGGIAGKIPEIVNSPNGTGILIKYQEGGFTLITISTVNDDDCIFVGRYNTNSIIEDYFGISWPEMISEFRTIIFAYFGVEI
jgi:hypothetical protein